MIWSVAKTPKLVIYGAGAATIIAVGLHIYSTIYNEGADDARREIDRINDQLVEGSLEQRDAQSLCADAGGVFRFQSGGGGECVEFAPGDGE